MGAAILGNNAGPWAKRGPCKAGKGAGKTTAEATANKALAITSYKIGRQTHTIIIILFTFW